MRRCRRVFIRVLMTESSNTCDEHGSDDVRIVSAMRFSKSQPALWTRSGTFRGSPEGVRRKAHHLSASPPSIPGIPPKMFMRGGGYQHTGFDLFFSSGLTNNLPAMIPVTMLYGTPDDAAAQIAYIEKRGYPHRLCRDGRGARRQACHAGRLWRAVHPMGRRRFTKSIPNSN